MVFDEKEVKDTIQEVVDKIKENPYIIHNERDIQAMIYSKLSEYDSKHPISLKHRGKEVKNEDGDDFKTRLVHCEYFFGKNKKGEHNKKRFDIVIFDKESTKGIENNWLTKGKIDDYDIINLKHVIEVKCELGGGGPENRQFDSSLAKSDIDRLIEFRSLQKNNPSLHFVYIARWPTKGDIRDDLKKFKKGLENYCGKKKKGVNFYSALIFPT